MKNQLGTMAVAVAAAMMTFISCSREDGKAPVSSDGNFSVTLSFKNAATTRADGAAAIDGTEIGIEDGYLCFANSGNAITKVYTISADATAGDNIRNSDLGAVAVTLQNVPGTSSKAYMIANKGSLAAPSTGGDMTAYLNSTMNVTEQSDYTKVTCVDDADLTDVSAGKKAAAIELATNVSRIQIKDLAFQGVTGKVAGIFINGFYTSMELDGGTASLQRSFEKLDYSAGAAGSIFTDALQGCVYDTFDKTIAADAVNPENEVWGYNLFASATPQIIIKLTDVVAGAYNYADPQFVTVNGFKDKTTSAPIDNLTGGIIYTIESGALVIKPEHLSAEPGVTPFAVDVTVDHAQWEETLVVPNL